MILAIKAERVVGNDLLNAELPTHENGDCVLPPQLKDLEGAIADCKEAFNTEMASLNLQVSRHAAWMSGIDGLGGRLYGTWGRSPALDRVPLFLT